MTKRDYQAIARAIHRGHDLARTTGITAMTPQEFADRVVGYVESNLADIMAQDNPRFNRALFIEACETGKCKGMKA